MSAKDFTADRREVLVITTGALILPVALTGAAHAAQAKVAGPGAGRGQGFDNGWLFRRGEGPGQEAGSLDDSAWRTVDLPHDWSIEDVPGGTAPDQRGPFDRKAIGGKDTGFTLGGEGWYRKHFRLAGLAADARAELLFDGVYGECQVWLNGKEVGSHLHGYAPFAVDLTDALDRRGENVLAIRVRNMGRNSRWYSGSGLYRQVTLDVLPAGARLARWGVAAWTRRLEGGSAQIDVTTEIVAPDAALSLVTRLRDAAGRIVAQAVTDAAGAEVIKQALTVRGPRLWSPAKPDLHTLETELRRGDVVVDRMVQPFGIRIFTMDAASGLHVNGTRVVIRGGCIHHDNGLLGGCAFPQADDRRVRLLKARGYNAIRSAHNPASQTLLDACDRHGILMLNEAFDMWHAGKNDDDYHIHFSRDWERPLTAMVRSARNRACVFAWSIGNEIPDRSSPEGIEWGWRLANAVRAIDSTRPVTAALNGILGPLVKVSAATARPGHGGEVDNATAAFLDLAGYNYRLDDIEKDEAEHGGRVVVATETFPGDCWDYQDLARRAPYVLGEFLWTAMDYLGEAGIGATENVAQNSTMPFPFTGWPWMVAWCGDIDLIGDQKAPSHYRDAVWGISKLEMAVQRPVPEGRKESFSNWGWHDELQSWSWAGHQGQDMAIRLYTPGDRVELHLNGVKVGEKALTSADKMRGEIKVPYAPGVLEARAFSGSREIARRTLETVGAPAQLRLRAESKAMQRGRQSLAYISIDVLDSSGRLVPDGDVKVSLAITGAAQLAGFGSANPLATGSFQASASRSFRGRALAILRGTNRKGLVRITASGDGLAPQSLTISAD